MNDLTEKLKELLMGCDFETFSTDEIAQQLAPEVEKMMPRWLPVSERLPDEGQVVDVWGDKLRIPDVEFHPDK